MAVCSGRLRAGGSEWRRSCVHVSLVACVDHTHVPRRGTAGCAGFQPWAQDKTPLEHGLWGHRKSVLGRDSPLRSSTWWLCEKKLVLPDILHARARLADPLGLLSGSFLRLAEK